uniref:Uncharacterized protein n=1 Tax=Verrucosispora sp. MS100047 TaxID=1410949 RepID=A0A097CRI4_9ACTN|nr:hypothetical protein VASRM7_6 [Verrucosispora sp. MS100047]
MARGGVEPPTFRFSVGRSYQLSYLAVLLGPCYPAGSPPTGSPVPIRRTPRVVRAAVSACGPDGT